MKISLEWLSDHVDLPAGLGTARLAHDLTLHTVEVEGWEEVDGDVVLHIDNKSLTNRPDLWGHHGIARELAVIYGVPLRALPSPARPAPVQHLVGAPDPSLCRRFTAVEFSLDEVPGTPARIADRLRRIGEAPVDFCVDLSTYVMFTVGQPSQVYDADRLSLPLSARPAAAPHRVEVLDGRVVELPPGVPVAEDADGPVAVAGLAGSASRAVSAASRRFVLEVAALRPTPVRRACQRLGLRTEAAARFEKGLDTQRVDLAVDLFLDLLRRYAPTVRVAGMQDVAPEPTTGTRVTVDRGFLDRQLGERLPDGEIERILGGLGFGTDLTDRALQVLSPTWRSTGDVSLPQDVVEELARVHGLDRLVEARPVVQLAPVRSLNHRPLSRVVRDQLASRAGLQEVLTYPWVPDDLLAATGIAKETTVRIDAPPAPDRDSLRPSVLPNLLRAVATNLRYGTGFGLFEVGTVFPGGPWAQCHGVHEPMPPQGTALGLVLVGEDGAELFRRAVGVLAMLRRHCHLTEFAHHTELAEDTRAGDGMPMPPWADPSGRLALRADGTVVGAVGLLTPRVRRAVGIEGAQVACAELRLDQLSRHPSRENRFERLPHLPDADFDLSVVVSDEVRWDHVEAAALRAHPLVVAVAHVEEYRGSWVPAGHRSLTLRVTLRPQDGTLTADVIAAARADVLTRLGAALGARLR